MDNIFCFSDFLADRERYQLWRGTRPIRLERIPLDLLFLLLENQGKLVSRTQIVAKLWGNDLFLDTDRSINTAIRKIRRALDDDPHHPRFIETVVGQGYRFVAPLFFETRARHAGPSFQDLPEETATDSKDTEIRLWDFTIETRSGIPVLTCNAAVTEVSLGRITLLELDLPSDVSLPLNSMGRLLMGLHGLRASLTSDTAQALNILSSHVLKRGLTGVTSRSELPDESPSLQFAEPANVGSPG